MHRGTLKAWNEARGFGFITPTQGGVSRMVAPYAFNALMAAAPKIFAL